MTSSNSLRVAWLAGGIGLLSACAAPVAIDGPGVSQAVLGEPALAFAAPPAGQAALNDEARAAVEAALAERGYAPDPDARQRVDVAFAIAPIDVEVVDHNAADKGESLMSRIALCKRQRYVLAVAILDRDDGRVLFRNRASLARCQRAADAVLPVLARAVVEGA